MSRARRFVLVASDLDGTLLRTDDTISARTRAAVHAAVGAGAMFVYATGRPPRWVDPVVEAVGHYGFAVASNGAYVIDLSISDVRGRIVDRDELQPDDGLAVVSIIRSLLGDDVLFAADSVEGFAREPGYWTRFVVPDDAPEGPMEQLLVRPFAKLLFRHHSMTDEVYAALVRAVGTHATLTFGATPAFIGERVLPDGETVIEVQAHGCSKAAALRRIGERIGHASQHGEGAVVFGDMPNDAEMLAWADHGVAMANAHGDLKAIADEITASNDDDGVALVLEREFAT